MGMYGYGSITPLTLAARPTLVAKKYNTRGPCNKRTDWLTDWQSDRITEICDKDGKITI